MISKQPVYPQRVRTVPKQFSWLDHRLVHDRYIEQCSHPAAMLYLFLVTVSDARGLSYYGDDSIMKRLSMDLLTLDKARENLIHIGLIAWQKPLYQVLSLDFSSQQPSKRPVMNRPLSLGDIFKQATERTSHD
ncbi:MAG: hypothetical protein EHJ94_01935 [Deltaproteobacteria bacterium]|nr:MAG: hypothetical protein EHJ94_01935 [Deltaproteobacteria bacterium]